MNLKDKLKKVLAEYKSLGIAEQIDYDKFYLYSLITHSSYMNYQKVPERLEAFCQEMNERRRALIDSDDVISQ